MSLPAQAGGRYTGPVQAAPAPQEPYPGPEQYPYDDVPVTPVPTDPGIRVVPNPDGSEVGPLYVSPEADRWIKANVYDRGLVVDWGSMEIFDPETGEVKGTVPKSFPKMI